ncbi:LLM class flavin-dependent oxidoreductase [Salipaludibacillus daqingensis]|uniref:LLM class flavin-dependent oxidoreductase n=1 Tax=Salipaludibacillus daqingensis TaxID=3041001 RepID=UPI00247642B4|nr:LLM class flavin-dependent oxidoreductase [Salipaludibacillus daqingensis]
MKLSVLDPSPILENQTPQEALLDSVKLAQLAEELGYTRFWMTEHHDLSGLASSAPEVILSYVGAHTKTIRLGTGAVLLPFYKPYKVAEVHHTLASLFPGRIDLGIGRAPGGSAQATNALSDQYLKQVWKIPEKVKELLLFIDQKHSDLLASPVPTIAPTPWILGTSKKSADLAAKNGVGYVFGEFMSDHDGEEMIHEYLKTYQSRYGESSPQVIVTVSAICAKTDELAEKMAYRSFIWSLINENRLTDVSAKPLEEQVNEYKLNEVELEKLEAMKQKVVFGDPNTVKRKLEMLQSKYQANEMMIFTSILSANDRRESYRLIAKEFFK